MNSFLELLEKNYELFNSTNGGIIQFFQFSDDVYLVFNRIFSQINQHYLENCTTSGKNAYAPNRVFVKKDNSGKVYLEVYGNDNKTVLVIVNDLSSPLNYQHIVGKKITESRFLSILDSYQRSKLEKYGISKRLIKEEIPPINGLVEMDIEKLIDYYKYLNEVYFKIPSSVEVFDEPDNQQTPAQKIGGHAPDRKNEIIDYKTRRDELLKHHPFQEIQFVGSKTDAKLDAYLYEKDGFILAIIEPVSGLGYQYALNLGNIDKNNTDLIKEMLKAVLEAKEEIILLDDAIMRNHTTLETFKENLEVFLNNAKTSKKFFYDTKKAKEVYSQEIKTK